MFFGGAGVSTESGIPDFRSVDGLYNQRYKYPPEVMLSHDFFMNNTIDFFDFYREKMIYTKAIPNMAHIKLSELEKSGKLKAVITQNIDGLHTAAGSENVLELHGSILRNYCMDCNKFYTVDSIINCAGIPKCDCGGIIKPNVVLYGEPLNNTVMQQAITAVSACDCLIIGGTSLAVYPAAGLISYYSKTKLVLINKSETSYDRRANLVINDSIGKVLGEISI